MGAETQTHQRKHLMLVTVQTEIMLPLNHRTAVLPRSWGTHGRTSPRGYGGAGPADTDLEPLASVTVRQ